MMVAGISLIRTTIWRKRHFESLFGHARLGWYEHVCKCSGGSFSRVRRVGSSEDSTKREQPTEVYTVVEISYRNPWWKNLTCHRNVYGQKQGTYLLTSSASVNSNLNVKLQRFLVWIWSSRNGNTTSTSSWFSEAWNVAFLSSFCGASISIYFSTDIVGHGKTESPGVCFILKSAQLGYSMGGWTALRWRAISRICTSLLVSKNCLQLGSKGDERKERVKKDETNLAR